MKQEILDLADKWSRVLSWKEPRKMHYSLKGLVSCPVCRKSVNLRDLKTVRNSIKCKDCK